MNLVMKRQQRKNSLVEAESQLQAAMALCNERYELMTCVRSYLHDFDCHQIIANVDARDVLTDVNHFCTVSLLARDVESRINSFLESK